MADDKQGYSWVDDDSTQITIVDTEDVSLWVRVGPVYGSDSKINAMPGVWVELQSKYMESDLHGPVLIDPETWDELDKMVRERIAKFSPSNY